jgi:hypothetical protein
MAQQYYYEEIGKWIPVQHTTVRNRHQEITRSRASANFRSGRAHLSLEEEKVLLDYIDDVATRGFPLTHGRLAECANHIITSRDPSFKGVGHNWTYHFLDRHFARLRSSWTKTLDTARGTAVNPATVAEFYRLLGQLYQEYAFTASCVFGGDESGLMSGVAQKERAIGPRGRNTQHQICIENRENTTVIVTICADGHALDPILVMKGQGFGVRWADQENEINASYVSIPSTRT